MAVYATAAEHLARARELLTDLVEVDPELRRGLIEIVATQALVAADTEPGASEALRRDALRMAEDLARTRDDAESRTVVAQQHSQLGTLLASQGRRVEADSEHRRAHELWTELAATTRMRGHRVAAARAEQDLAEVARACGDHAAAMASYERSVAACERLAMEFGDAIGAREQSHALQHFADFLLDLGDAQGAAATAARASALIAVLPQRHEDVDLQCDLALCLRTEAEAAAALQHFDDAEARYRRAIALLETAATAASCRWPMRQLIDLLIDFAEFLQSRDDFAEAAVLRERTAVLRARVARA